MRLPIEDIREPLNPDASASSSESTNESEYVSATERSHARVPRLELMSGNESNEEKVPLDEFTVFAQTHRSSSKSH